MKRLAAAAAILLAVACSSTPQGPKANIPEPGFDVEQTFGPGELGYPEGPIDVKYMLHITNHSTIPMTLKRLNIHTVNPAGGAYTLNPPFEHSFNVVVPPGGEKDVELWAHATGYGVSMRDREPVTVKGIAYFETPQGYYIRNVNQEMQQ
jgi:hypothetical protein